jgi:hypothetical protein
MFRFLRKVMVIITAVIQILTIVNELIEALEAQDLNACAI